MNVGIFCMDNGSVLTKVLWRLAAFLLFQLRFSPLSSAAFFVPRRRVSGFGRQHESKEGPAFSQNRRVEHV